MAYVRQGSDMHHCSDAYGKMPAVISARAACAPVLGAGGFGLTCLDKTAYGVFQKQQVTLRQCFDMFGRHAAKWPGRFAAFPRGRRFHQGSGRSHGALAHFEPVQADVQRQGQSSYRTAAEPLASLVAADRALRQTAYTSEILLGVTPQYTSLSQSV